MPDSDNNKPLRTSRVTRDDVARHAQVSTAVVSYVINNGPRSVAPETRRRVEQAIAALGYFPNTIARSLRSDQSNTIGLLLPSLTDPECAQIASDLQSVCHDEGYLVLLCASERDLSSEERAIGMLRSHQVDGVVILPTQDSPALLRSLLFAGLPTVVIDRYLPNAHSITVDDLEGVIEAFEDGFTVETGDRTPSREYVAWMREVPGLSASVRRLGAYDVTDGAGMAGPKALVRYMFATGTSYLPRLDDQHGPDRVCGAISVVGGNLATPRSRQC
jgi:LacI family transcriptional regulator